MKCRHARSGHRVGLLTLLCGLSLCVAGVASPFWRRMGQTGKKRRCSHFEGLWQQCTQCSQFASRCHFSDRTAGLWRTIQTLQLASLISVAGGIICCAFGVHKKRCIHGKCSTPAMAAFTGGFIGLVADLMYVGYIEHHMQHLHQQHVYAWSFALSVAGSALCLLASLILSMAGALCLPKYTSQMPEPYQHYRHCHIGLDANGYPIYLPYHPEEQRSEVATISVCHKQLLFVHHSSRQIQPAVGRKQILNGRAWYSPCGDKPNLSDLSRQICMYDRECSTQTGGNVVSPTVYDQVPCCSTRKVWKLESRQDEVSSQIDLLPMGPGSLHSLGLRGNEQRDESASSVQCQTNWANRSAHAEACYPIMPSTLPAEQIKMEQDEQAVYTVGGSMNGFPCSS